MTKFGIKVTWSSTDSPDINAISERRFRTLREIILVVLSDSGIPATFLVGFVCTCMLDSWWMSLIECIPGGSVPAYRGCVAGGAT
mmetsp:Transcript_18894/g.27263  ORF Transcript_18894/g.27263 Transcript_18894/m.27263 type:complete len:85 (+) Transcript_18894:450-704(+)